MNDRETSKRMQEAYEELLGAPLPEWLDGLGLPADADPLMQVRFRELKEGDRDVFSVFGVLAARHMLTAFRENGDSRLRPHSGGVLLGLFALALSVEKKESK